LTEPDQFNDQLTHGTRRECLICLGTELLCSIQL
jgi:hypothetical protein